MQGEERGEHVVGGHSPREGTVCAKAQRQDVMHRGARHVSALGRTPERTWRGGQGQVTRGLMLCRASCHCFPGSHF